jgi:hypothetical protein
MALVGTSTAKAQVGDDLTEHFGRVSSADVYLEFESDEPDVYTMQFDVTDDGITEIFLASEYEFYSAGEVRWHVYSPSGPGDDALRYVGSIDLTANHFRFDPNTQRLLRVSVIPTGVEGEEYIETFESCAFSIGGIECTDAPEIGDDLAAHYDASRQFRAEAANEWRGYWRDIHGAARSRDPSRVSWKLRMA